MRYVNGIVKTATAVVTVFWTMVMAAPAALADHGSAWSLQRGVPQAGEGTALGAWIIFGLLLALAVFATARMLMQRRKSAAATAADENGTAVARSESKAA